jgi:hypothetical protein
MNFFKLFFCLSWSEDASISISSCHIFPFCFNSPVVVHIRQSLCLFLLQYFFILILIFISISFFVWLTSIQTCPRLSPVQCCLFFQSIHPSIHRSIHHSIQLYRDHQINQNVKSNQSQNQKLKLKQKAMTQGDIHRSQPMTGGP